MFRLLNVSINAVSSSNLPFSSMVGIYVNHPEDRDSIAGRFISKTQKWYLMPPWLTQHYKVRIKSKRSKPGKGIPWHKNGSPNLGQKTRPYNNKQKQKKKRKSEKINDFAVPADHRIKLKECEKKYKYLDLARELKKLWNMKVALIPIVIGAFGTVTKVWFKGLEDLEVGGTVRILRRVLENWVDLLSLNLQWKTTAYADLKN